MAENQTTREKTAGREKKRAGLEGKPVISVAEAAEKWGISVRRANPVSYTHLTLPTIYAV